jgi:hypothetical protein
LPLLLQTTKFEIVVHMGHAGCKYHHAPEFGRWRRIMFWNMAGLTFRPLIVRVTLAGASSFWELGYLPFGQHPPLE